MDLFFELPIDSFDWQRWRSCEIFEKFQFACREYDIIRSRDLIRKYAIGYIDASRILCRPKPDHYAIMFLIDGEFSWCHLMKKEFVKIFSINIKTLQEISLPTG